MVKVNESMHEDGPQSSFSVDESFVILERSASQELNNQFASHVSEQASSYPAAVPQNNSTAGLSRLDSQSLQNSSYVPGSLPTDLSPEEIQRKLHEVLQENLQLRETLQQNNLAMKQQFTTLAMWQEEVYKVHQNHKAKFAETKELVLKLRAENTELKKMLEEYKETGSLVPGSSETQLMRENVELKGKVAELQEQLSTAMPRTEHLQGISPTKKEQEMSTVLEQVNRQLETAERARRQLSVDVERLTAQKTRLENDRSALKSEMDGQKQQLQKLQRQNEELEQKITHLQKQHQQELHDYAVRAHEQQLQVASQPPGVQQSCSDEVQRLMLQLEEQKSLVCCLTDELRKERMRSKVAAPTVAEKDAQSYVDEPSSLAHGLRDCEETFEDIRSYLAENFERFTSFDSFLQMVSDSMNQWKEKETVDRNAVATLETEVQELKKRLAWERITNNEKRQKLTEAQEKFRNLCSEYETVAKELKNFYDEQKSKDRHSNAYHEVQARGFTEKMDSMTAQILTLEETLAQKNKEHIQLVESVKKLELENEAIALLKAQVEVYQSDFNAEREARENLAGEKERLAEDLRHLQRQNQHLLDELQAYRQNSFEQMQRTPLISTAPIGWSTIGTPGRIERQVPGTLSPRRLSPGPQQYQPLPAEHNDQPMRVHDEDIPAPKRYYCPVCNMEFAQVPLLQHHVEGCLESQS